MQIVLDSCKGVMYNVYMMSNTNTEATKMKPEYETPKGTYSTYEQAATACEQCDMDPTTCIKIVLMGADEART